MVTDITNTAIHYKEAHRPHPLELLPFKLDETLVSTVLADTLDNTSLAETLDTSSNTSTSTLLGQRREHYPDASTTPELPPRDP